MKNEKGITLIALTITIIVLIILASITTYTGLSTVRSSKLTRFEQELEIMQAQVNVLYEKYKDETTIEIGKSIDEADAEKVNNAFNAVNAYNSNIVSPDDYRYFDKQTIENLDISGIENEYLVDILNREVISLDGFEYEGEIYYNLLQITGREKISEGIERGGVNFSVERERITNGWRISIKDIQYSKYVGKGNVQYKLLTSDEWKTVEQDLRRDYCSFTIKNDGVYIIKITDAAGKSAEEQIECLD